MPSAHAINPVLRQLLLAVDDDVIGLPVGCLQRARWGAILG